MKPINLLLLVCFLSYSKQGVSSEQNVEKVQSNFNISTENVKTVSNSNTEQSLKIKKYKADDPIELYNLIYMLLPDEGEAEAEAEDYVSWERAEEVKIVKWKKKTLDEFVNLYTKEGEVNVKVNDVVSFNNFYLMGNENGYFILGTGHDVFGEGDLRPGIIVRIEELFHGKEYTFKEISITESGTLNNLYEVKFPNKKQVWMKIHWEAGKNYEYYSLNFYLNKNDINKYD